MKHFTIKQYAGMVNKMSRQGLGQGAIKESRDIWRLPKNMALLDDDAKIAARHYIKGENERLT